MKYGKFFFIAVAILIYAYNTFNSLLSYRHVMDTDLEFWLMVIFNGAFLFWLIFRFIRNIKSDVSGLPVDDEFTKRLFRQTSASTLPVLLVIWFLLMLIMDQYDVGFGLISSIAMVLTFIIYAAVFRYYSIIGLPDEE